MKVLFYARPDVVRARECSSQKCCGHLSIFVQYADEPVWSYLVCPFCGAVEICNLIVPDEVRTAFCERLRQPERELAEFNERLQQRQGTQLNGTLRLPKLLGHAMHVRSAGLHHRVAAAGLVGDAQIATRRGDEKG